MNLFRENNHIEFKLIWKDDYLKQICGFANAEGGHLFIGVADDGRIKGVPDTQKLLEDIPNKIISLLGITVNVESVTENKVDYLDITVSPSSVPISYRGKYFVRSGTTTQELSGHELRQFILKKNNITWDEITIPKADINDLNSETLNEFVRIAINQKRIYVKADKDNSVEVLKNLDLMTSDNLVTRAAVLLFGKRPQHFIHSAIVKIGRFGATDADLISQDIIEGNLLEMPDKIMTLLRVKYLKSNISYQGIQRIETLEYPEKVLREVLFNAIVHRDYGEQTDITIKIFDDKIVFWNSGRLLQPLNIEMLSKPHPSKRRNALIADVFFRMGYIEAWGRGIHLINNEMREVGLPLPEIIEYAGGIQITIFNQNEGINIASKSALETLPKTLPKTGQLIIKLISENKSITLVEMARKCHVSKQAIQNNINILKQRKIIKRIGPNKGGYWEVLQDKD